MTKPYELKTPIRFESGYFWDRENKMIAQMRGWGWMQYKKNPEKLQDSIGKYICECINNNNQKEHKKLVPATPSDVTGTRVY